MPRTCTVCGHPARAALDAALVAGAPLRDIARQFAVSKDALFRHRAAHVSARLAQARQAAAVAQADDLLGQLQGLQAKALDLLRQAEAAGDTRTALVGVREARACLELLAELTAQLDRRPTLNLLVSPEWLAARSALLMALGPYPAARVAVAEALTRLEEATPDGARA